MHATRGALVYTYAYIYVHGERFRSPKLSRVREVRLELGALETPQTTRLDLPSDPAYHTQYVCSTTPDCI